jgi:hypothetical protein
MVEPQVSSPRMSLAHINVPKLATTCFSYFDLSTMMNQFQTVCFAAFIILARIAPVIAFVAPSSSVARAFAPLKFAEHNDDKYFSVGLSRILIKASWARLEPWPRSLPLPLPNTRSKRQAAVYQQDLLGCWV